MLYNLLSGSSYQSILLLPISLTNETISVLLCLKSSAFSDQMKEQIRDIEIRARKELLDHIAHFPPFLKGYSAVHSRVLCPFYIIIWEHGKDKETVLVCGNVSSFQVVFYPAMGCSKAVIAAIIQNRSICISPVLQL